jgi:hypothetical protein
MKVLMHALAASCEELRARTGNPPLRMVYDFWHNEEYRFLVTTKINQDGVWLFTNLALSGSFNREVLVKVTRLQ